MILKPNIEDDTPSVNTSQSLSSAPLPPPPISTSNPRFLDPQITPFSPNYTTPNSFGWPTNHPNYVPNYVGMSSIPHSSSSSNQTETKPDLHLGPYPNLTETHLNRNPFFRFGSETNQNDNKIHSILRLGSEKTHEPSRVNSIVPPLSSSAQWFPNRISSGLNRVEKNETSGFELGCLTLNQNTLEPVSKNRLVRVEPVKGKLVLVQPQSKDKLVLVQPQSKDELKEPDEPVEKKQNQSDLIRRGKSPLKAKGSSEINDAAGEGEGEREGSGEKEEEEEVEAERSDEEEPIAEILKTWNLRPRKQVKKPEDKVNIGSSGGGRSRRPVALARASKPRSAKSHARPSSERPVVKEKLGFEFTLTVTKEEIEHDFMQMTGEQPPKKPLKRPKIVQKNLDVLFPGMYLTNVTPEKYGVNDKPPPLKC